MLKSLQCLQYMTHRQRHTGSCAVCVWVCVRARARVCVCGGGGGAVVCACFVKCIKRILLVVIFIHLIDFMFIHRIKLLYSV